MPLGRRGGVTGMMISEATPTAAAPPPWFLDACIPFFFLHFLQPHLRHVEVVRLGIKPELQLLAYATAMAMHDLSLIWDLHCNLQQCQILEPLSKARDGTCNLMDTSQVHNPLSHNKNSSCILTGD